MYKVSKNSTQLRYPHIFKVLGIDKEDDIKTGDKDIDDYFGIDQDGKITEMEEVKETGHDVSNHDTDPAFVSNKVVPKPNKSNKNDKSKGEVPGSNQETNEDHILEEQVTDTQPNFDTESNKFITQPRGNYSFKSSLSLALPTTFYTLFKAKSWLYSFKSSKKLSLLYNLPISQLTFQNITISL